MCQVKILTFRYSLSKGNLLSATSLTALRRTYTLSVIREIETISLDMPHIAEAL